MSFTWTAPPQGTGTVTFRFAVVQVFNTFWANQMGPVLEGMLVVLLSLQLIHVRTLHQLQYIICFILIT